MRIKETIVVEGRDDTNAIKRALDAETIETHGFGIKAETWDLLGKAYGSTGLILFTDPDHAGEEIRKRITRRFPKVKQAYLSVQDATRAGDIGIENAGPEDILAALERAHCVIEFPHAAFTMDDLAGGGLVGLSDSAAKRQQLGKALGIGYGNSKRFLAKLNQFGITREEFDHQLIQIGKGPEHR